MGGPLVPLVFAFLALSRPAAADTITWFAAGEITSVAGPANYFWPGLGIGTPWSLTFDLDSSSPPRSANLAGVAGCNAYSTGPATFTLGGFTYQSAGGSAYTNFNVTDFGCTAFSPSQEPGLISFTFFQWTQQPGAWDLNLSPSITVFAYYDALATDGRLPITPTISAHPGWFGGLEHEAMQKILEFRSGFNPTTLDAQPTPVPEPATLTMFGVGLAGLAARSRKRRNP